MPVTHFLSSTWLLEKLRTAAFVVTMLTYTDVYFLRAETELVCRHNHIMPLNKLTKAVQRLRLRLRRALPEGEDFIHALRMCLEHIGGVPQIVNLDYLKAEVIKYHRY